MASATYMPHRGHHHEDVRPPRTGPWHAAGSTMAFMRHLMGPSIVLVGLVACSADDGAHLTFSAPMGPTKAASFDLVLATPDLVPAIRNQRLGPSGTAAEEVTYYLQRTTAGAESEHGSIAKVEGFTLRVEPNTGISDTAFIPFLLLHDEAGALVGIGTYHAGDSTDPAPIVVRRGEIDRYTLVIEPVTQIVDTAPLVAQEALAVSCYHADQTTWPSGIAWRTAAGRELRVLFPDQGEGTDATTRELDLDCDGHVVTPADASADCDDTRGWFHPGAVEACDGYDTNCDGSPYVVSACPQTTGGCTSNPSSGVALCDDTTGTPGGLCAGEGDRSV